MRFLLDTDTCSAQIRGDPRIFSRLIQHGEQLGISVVTVAELKRWVFRSNTPQRIRLGMQNLLLNIPTISLTDEIADVAGRVGARVWDEHRRIAMTDLIIAATAIVHDLTVVTRNVRDFNIVPNLRLDDWLVE